MTPQHTIKVESNPTLVRDSYSKAIINTDVSAYNMVCHRRKQVADNKATIDDLYAKINGLYDIIDILLDWKESVITANQEKVSKIKNK